MYKWRDGGWTREGEEIERGWREGEGEKRERRGRGKEEERDREGRESGGEGGRGRENFNIKIRVVFFLGDKFYDIILKCDKHTICSILQNPIRPGR